jgi:predicted nucleic acid-binding protein
VALVIDASAMVELLLRSPAARAVEAAILDTDAFAPELLDVEVISALARLEREGELEARFARNALNVLLEAPVTRVPHAGLIMDAWMRRHNLSAYDSVYVALAARLGCPLITGDVRLARAPGLGITVNLVSA